MAALKKFLGLIVSLTCLFSAANANSGSATYYDEYNPSKCDGFGTPRFHVAAASAAIWDGNACGRRYRVTCTGATNLGDPHPCTGASVDVQIVDFCPACRGTIDLSEDAFATIADLSAGNILIEYYQI